MFTRLLARLRLVAVTGCSWLISREGLLLLAIVVLGACLRLWNLGQLLMMVHDYDEGAWSLTARFMADGDMPYRDFLLVHPPAYAVLLSTVYRVFGYGFLTGRYLGVALSVILIVLAYLVGRRLHGPLAGVAAAGLFAVSPDLVYYGRRVVQEPLALVFLLLALLVVGSSLERVSWRRSLALGTLLGFMVATKYTFIPAAAGIVLALSLVAGGGSWKTIRHAVSKEFWFIYTCLSLAAIALVALLRWAVGIDVPVPFFQPLYLTPGHFAVVVLVFGCPLASVIVVTRTGSVIALWLRSAFTRDSLRIGLWSSLGVSLGFLILVGPFAMVEPAEFLRQTLVLHVQRPVAVPSYVELLRTVWANTSFTRFAVLPMLTIPPLVVCLLRRSENVSPNVFFTVSLLVALLLCQLWIPIPRYYVATLPFVLLAVAGLLSFDGQTEHRDRKLSFVTGVSAFGILSLSAAIMLLTNYTGYDILSRSPQTLELEARREATRFLDSVGARRVYSTSPSTVALSSSLESSRQFDTFALLWLENVPASKIVDSLVAEGVDYAVIDGWLWYWGGDRTEDIVSLAVEIRRRGELVAHIMPESPAAMEVYALKGTAALP